MEGRAVQLAGLYVHLVTLLLLSSKMLTLNVAELPQIGRHIDVNSDWAQELTRHSQIFHRTILQCG